MPTSVRLTQDLEARLRGIAGSEGVPLSEVVRRAVRRYVDEAGRSLRVRVADAIGAVESGGGRARRTGEAFKRVVRRRS